MADNAKLYQIHRFNGENFHLWCRQMEIFMAENKLKPLILGTEVRSEENSETWDAKDAEAQGFLMRGLELDQLKYLTDCTTAAAMWSRLETVHSEKSDQSVQILLDKFINSKMGEEEKIADYIANVVSIAQRLKDMDMEQKTQVIIAKVLGSLPVKFDHVRTAWYAVPSNMQTIEKLTDHLVNEEILLNSRMSTNGNNKNADAAFLARSKRNKAGNPHTNNNIDDNGLQYKSSNFKRNAQCNYCSKYGHFARDCHKKFFDRRNASKNQSHVAQTSSDFECDYTNEGELFIAESYLMYQKEAQDCWFADSGATDHMTFQRDLFENYETFKEICIAFV
ncbi:POLX protein, partial [Pseudoatta argentina]